VGSNGVSFLAPDEKVVILMLKKYRNGLHITRGTIEVEVLVCYSLENSK
jgi:hypothetical protein